MLGVGGLVLLVAAIAAVGAVVLGVLLVGLWRRVRALLAELAALADRLGEVRASVDGTLAHTDPGQTGDRLPASGWDPASGPRRP